MKKHFDCNQKYFNIIDNSEKAYYLGLLLADGQCKIRCDGGKYLVRLTLKGEDKYILVNLLKCLNSNHNIYAVKCKNYPENKYYEIRIQNQELAKDLIKHNFIPNKSLILEFPNTVPDLIMKDFIRGFLDGDGSIGSGLSTNKKYREYSVRFYTTIMFAKVLKDVINKLIGVNMCLYKDKTCKNNVSTVAKIHGNKQVYKFLSWIYNDSTICLERKKVRFDELINQYNTLYGSVPK